MLKVTKTTKTERQIKQDLLDSIKAEYGKITGLHSWIHHKDDITALESARKYTGTFNDVLHKEVEWGEDGVLFIYFTPIL